MILRNVKGPLFLYHPEQAILFVMVLSLRACQLRPGARSHRSLRLLPQCIHPSSRANGARCRPSHIWRPAHESPHHHLHLHPSSRPSVGQSHLDRKGAGRDEKCWPDSCGPPNTIPREFCDRLDGPSRRLVARPELLCMSLELHCLAKASSCAWISR